ncbi:MAG: hypothetical protein ABSF90_10485 [Syntrophobacteraceae bacterium]|jgi:hypothetical protein
MKYQKKSNEQDIIELKDEIVRTPSKPNKIVALFVLGAALLILGSMLQDIANLISRFVK